jgi:hypothetical protein
MLQRHFSAGRQGDGEGGAWPTSVGPKVLDSSGRPRLAKPSSLSHPIVQTRLRTRAARDRFDQEADRVAHRVMRQPAPAGACSPVSATAGACCQRATDPSREEETFSLNDLLSMKEKPGLAHAATPAAATALRRIERGGQPIDHATRTSMEGRFGQDFGRVRIHRDARAAEAAEAIGARAFTFGDHIAFGAGEFQPATLQGQRLLAHELTHVLQQTGTSGLVQRTCDCTTGRRATGSEHTGLAAAFPHLAADDYCIIAPPDSSYNCIAWSVSNTNQWIWDQVDSVYGDGDGTASIADFDAFYQATQSLTPTDQPNSNTLVALFAKGTNPTHAALTSSFPPSCGQIPFTSKLGKQWVISHDLNQLEGGSVYGNIVRYYE